MKIKLGDKEFSLCTTMRVPYELQKEFGNVPFTGVFEKLQTSDMVEQVKVIYVAFNALNKDMYTFEQFLDLILDNWSMNEMYEVLGKVIVAITGVNPDEVADQSKKAKRGN